jgi:hypothetical protein
MTREYLTRTIGLTLRIEFRRFGAGLLLLSRAGDASKAGPGGSDQFLEYTQMSREVCGAQGGRHCRGQRPIHFRLTYSFLPTSRFISAFASYIRSSTWFQDCAAAFPAPHQHSHLVSSPNIPNIRSSPRSVRFEQTSASQLSLQQNTRHSTAGWMLNSTRSRLYRNRSRL